MQSPAVVAPLVRKVHVTKGVRGGVGWRRPGYRRGCQWGAPGIPLSPVLFLVFMAPILEEMERWVTGEVGRVHVQFPSYVDDLHCVTGIQAIYLY